MDSCLDRRLEAELFESPVVVAAINEGSGGVAQLVEVWEDPAVDRLLLERPVEPFGHAVRLRLLDESEARRDAPVADLVHEVIREVLTPVVHAQGQAAGDV